MKISTDSLITLLPLFLLSSSIALAEKDYAREYQDLYGIRVTNQFATQIIHQLPKKDQAVYTLSKPMVSPIIETPVEAVTTTYDASPKKRPHLATDKSYPTIASKTALTEKLSNKGNYSIQILVTSSESKMKRFITEQQLGKGTWVEKVEKNGQFLYKIMYGHYTSRTEATADTHKLPPRVQKLKPWVRYIKQS